MGESNSRDKGTHVGEGVDSEGAVSEVGVVSSLGSGGEIFVGV